MTGSCAGDVILVLGVEDTSVRRFVNRYRGDGVRGAAALDLSSRGWVHFLDQFQAGSLVSEGEVIPSSRLRGVLVTIPRVEPWMLPHIKPSERAFVADELTAFLVCWLDALPCRVLNRASPACLCGPSASTLWWIQQARCAGVVVGEIREEGASELVVGVVSGQCLGAPGHEWEIAARRLSDHAGVGLLTVVFDRSVDAPVVIDAFPWADPSLFDQGELLIRALKGDAP